MVNNTYDFQCKKLSGRQSAVSTASGSNSASTAPVSSASGRRSVATSTSSDSPTEAATKHKLSPEDKVSIQKLYQSLDKAKMWKLSTGKVVELEMMKLAINQDYEQYVLKEKLREFCANLV